MLNFKEISRFWDIYYYPWKPSKKIIEIIKKQSFGNNILLLGSTKEIREIFLNRSIFVCDNSEEMYNINLVGNNSEKFLKKDWFNLKLGNYDLILGDLFFNLFPKFKQEELLKILVNNLSNNGKIIFRAVVKKDLKNQNKKLLELFKLLDLLKDENIKFNYLTFELVNYFGFNSQQIFKLLQKNDCNFANTFKNEYFKSTPYNGSKSYVFNQNEFENIFTSYSLKEIYSNDFIFISEKIYVLEI